MDRPSMLAQTDTVILAGGLGTRLRPALPDGLPKALAPINGKPFLEYLLLLLYRCGLRRIVLALGYGAQAVSDFLNARHWPADLMLSQSTEPAPLGTGGALRYVLPLTRSALIVAVNGDTLADVDYSRLIDFHLTHSARITIALAEVDDADRYGRVELEADGQVRRFVEKGVPGPGLINAGVYAVDRALIEALPAGQILSWERDVLAARCGRGLYGMPGCRRFIDIGTPSSLEEAQVFFEQLNKDGLP